MWVEVPDPPDSGPIFRMTASWLVVAFVFGTGAARSGVAGGLFALGLLGLLAGVLGLARGHVGWARIPNRTVSVYVVAAAALVVTTSGTVVRVGTPRDAALVGTSTPTRPALGPLTLLPDATASVPSRPRSTTRSTPTPSTGRPGAAVTEPVAEVRRRSAEASPPESPTRSVTSSVAPRPPTEAASSASPSVSPSAPPSPPSATPSVLPTPSTTEGGETATPTSL